jgi:hemolysin III
VLELAWTTAPKWLGGTVYLALGWVAVVAMPQLFARLGMAGGLLILAGGLIYSAGAAIYGLRRPDPVPAVFGLPPAGHRRRGRPLPGHRPVRPAQWLTDAPVGGPGR